MISLLTLGLLSAIGALFRGLTGFGYALIGSVTMAGLMAPRTLVPFILVNDFALTFLTLGDWRKSPVDVPVASLLVITGLVGAATGSVVAGVLDETTARLLVSLAVALAAGVALVRRPPAWLATRTFGVLLGLIVGAMLGAFAVGGPLVAAWLLAGGTAASRVRGTLAVFFGAVDAMSLASRVWLGTIGSDLGLMLAIEAIPTLAGFGIGVILHRRLSPETWHRIAASGLVVIALAGLVEAGRALFNLSP